MVYEYSCVLLWRVGLQATRGGIFLGGRRLSSGIDRQTVTELVNGSKREYDLKSMSWQWVGRGSRGRVLGNGINWCRSMLLPVGFPESVHACYAKFHYWQFFETVVGSAVTVLCSQALLSSLGVGALGSATGAVAIQWMLKDGFGELGKLYFIKRFAKMFDSHPKTWKLLGEFASLLGSTVQLSTIVLPSTWFLPLASLGYACHSLHYSVWGATHMTFARCFSLRGNVGDLVAKDSSQISLAHILGLFAGVGYLYVSDSLFLAFAVLGPLHFASTVFLINSVQFNVLHQANLTVLASHYASRREVQGLEKVTEQMGLFGEWLGGNVQLPKIHLGASILQTFNNRPEGLLTLLELSKDKNFMFYRDPNSLVYHVLYSYEATTRDIVESVLCVCKVERLLGISPDLSFTDTYKAAQSFSSAEIDDFLLRLSEKWDTEYVFWKDEGFRYVK